MNALKTALAFMIFSTLAGMTGTAGATQTWKFKVFLDEQQIGDHSFQVSSQQDHTYVQIKAEFDVYFMFFNVYSYKHTNYEVWNGNCLKSIHSTTDDNGDQLHVYGEKQGRYMQVTTVSGQHTAEGCIRTFAYWDPSSLDNQTLLNAQTGELMPVKLTYIGEDVIPVRDKLTAAKRYRLHTDEFTIDLWYSHDNEWLALNTTTEDGATLRYRIQ